MSTHENPGDSIHCPDRRDLTVQIIGNEAIGRDCRLLTFRCADLENAMPGQFVMVRVSDGTSDPLLRRPISIMDVFDDGRIALLYKVVGRGTRILADMVPGDCISVVGPLGTGFRMPPPDHTACLAGGGIGIPPLLFLARRLVTHAISVVACLGGRSKADVLLEDQFGNLGVPLHISTEDGSAGLKGRVTLPLEQCLRRHSGKMTVFACGPDAMLRAIDAMCLALDIPGQLAFEEHMGCGVGACLGCIIQTTRGFQRVCADGPVFPAGIVTKWGTK